MKSLRRAVPVCALACGLALVISSTAVADTASVLITGPSPYAACSQFDNSLTGSTFPNAEVEPQAAVHGSTAIAMWHQDRRSNGGARGIGVGYSTEINSPENKKFVETFKAAYKADPDLYGADSYGLIYAYKAAVENAKSTETDKVRAALRGLKWMTPQGEKTIRAGDHQATQTMYVVRITNGQFKIGGQVNGEDAIGADACTRF